MIEFGDLKYLLMAQNSAVTMFGWKDLLNAVSKPKSRLKCLDLSSNAIGKAGVATGSPLLSLPGVTLDYLNMSGCLLPDDGVETLKNKLREKNTKIKTWKLEPGNLLSDENVKELANSCK